MKKSVEMNKEYLKGLFQIIQHDLKHMAVETATGRYTSEFIGGLANKAKDGGYNSASEVLEYFAQKPQLFIESVKIRVF